MDPVPDPVPNPRPVGIIGAGTIAAAVAEQLAAGAVPGLVVHGFYTRATGELQVGPKLATLDELVQAPIVVEAASHDAVRECAERVLAAGSDLVCVSVGALADSGLRERLLAAALRGGAKLIIPSGAVGGLDLLRAAAETGLDEVMIEQRKPPKTLLPESEAAALTEPLVVFEGSVADVVGIYPKTTNVSAAVALAGLGFDRTQVRVVADPELGANQVLLSARGAFGRMTLQLENLASANPRTSTIVAHSVVASLRRLSAPLVIPG